MKKIKNNLQNIVLYTVLIASFLSISSTLAFAQTAPQAVTDLHAIPGVQQVELIWTAPFDNGSTITSYKIIMWQTGSDVFTTFPNLSTGTSAMVSDLKNGVSYSFKVIAVNSVGNSPDSNIVTAIPNPNLFTSAPDAINDLRATRENAQVKLTWSAPFDNGQVITGYQISYWQIGSSAVKTKTVTSTNAQITGLTNEIPYSFKVAAINSHGQGPDSNIVSATPSITVSASEPGQVRGLVVTPGDGQVLLAWNQPSSNGSPITGYRVTVTETGSQTFTTYPNVGTATKTTIAGLKNNVSYNFKVSAVNAVGIGKESVTVSTTPFKVNTIEITNIRTTSGDGKITLNWSVPSSSSDLISSYRIREYSPGFQSFVTHTILGKATLTTITGLANGLTYGFTILPVTSDGIGKESTLVYATPMSKPSSQNVPKSVKNLAVTPGDGRVTVSWLAPDGNQPITGYKVIYQKTGSSSFTTFLKTSSSTSAEIRGLTNGFSYNFKVVAFNDFGEGQESKTLVSTPKKPGSTLILPTWIKTNAKWWSEGLISDSEYVTGIEYLINQGIIKIK
jgi:large repetitive protein